MKSLHEMTASTVLPADRLLDHGVPPDPTLPQTPPTSPPPAPDGAPVRDPEPIVPPSPMQDPPSPHPPIVATPRSAARA